MTHDLQPYPEYKDSRLPWLGQIPAHWEVRRNGRLFGQRNETGFPELPILEVSLKTGVLVRDFENSTRKQVMSDRGKYKRAAKRDIAYNMMRMWQGAVGMAPIDGLVSPAYVVARPYPEVEPRYYAYLFRTETYMNEVNKYSHGIVVDRNRLYWDEFKQIPSPFPPRDEQAAIADFLDNHGQRVRQFIRKKRRLIEVLNEQKQAIIACAVTRGLDEHAHLKPSGIPWIGDIPRHWTVSRLKYFSRIIYGSSPHHSTYNTDGQGVILVNGPDEYSKEAFGETRAIKWTTHPVKFAPKGALLFCLRGSTTGRLNVCHADVSVGRGVAALVPRENAQYFRYAMMALRGHLKETFRGSTFPSVTSEHLNNYCLPKPPQDEQAAIAASIGDQTADLDIAIKRAQREIELIGDYRTRFINDVVTGKLDVRQLAPTAVEQASNGLGPVDDTEEFFEDELQDADDLEPVEEAVDGD